MATINLDNDGVFTVELTLEEARSDDDVVNEHVQEAITTAIDEAQGHVHMERGPIAYVVIAIKR